MSRTTSKFVARFAGIYEGSPWVAERAAEHLTESDSLDTIASVMADCVDNASLNEQLELIRAHPSLVPSPGCARRITAVSISEQASAGLDQCSIEEAEQFELLNREYSERFGFPFVMAVRGRSRREILKAFSSRLGNDWSSEFATAMDEIYKIARLRLEALEGIR